MEISERDGTHLYAYTVYTEYSVYTGCKIRKSVVIYFIAEQRRSILVRSAVS